MGNITKIFIRIIIGSFIFWKSSTAQVTFDPTILYPSDETEIETITVKYVDFEYSSEKNQRSRLSIQQRVLSHAQTNNEVLELLGGGTIKPSFNEDYVGLPPPPPGDDSAEALLPRMGNYFTITIESPLPFSQLKDALNEVNSLENIEIAYPLIAYPPPATSDFYQQGKQSWL